MVLDRRPRPRLQGRFQFPDAAVLAHGDGHDAAGPGGHGAGALTRTLPRRPVTARGAGRRAGRPPPARTANGPWDSRAIPRRSRRTAATPAIRPRARKGPPGPAFHAP